MCELKIIWSSHYDDMPIKMSNDHYSANYLPYMLPKKIMYRVSLGKILACYIVFVQEIESVLMYLSHICMDWIYLVACANTLWHVKIAGVVNQCAES